MRVPLVGSLSFFFFNDTATTEIYTLSLHDALPICRAGTPPAPPPPGKRARTCRSDRKSTRLNSSHDQISYAVFCLKKKKQQQRCRARRQAARRGTRRRRPRRTV